MGPQQRGWDNERVDVLSALKLLEQSINNLCDDLAEVRDGLAATLKELKDQAAARQEKLNDLTAQYMARGLQIKTLETEVDKLDKRVEEIEKLAPAVRIIIWVGALLGASIIALIWALITGKAEVVFR